MRKETILAIIAGVSIGLIIAFGAWKVAIIIKNEATPQPSTKESPQPNSVNDNFSLTIANLSELDIITQNPLILKGLTKPQSNIIVSTDEKDYSTISKDDGSFEIEISLTAGLSEIKITSFDSSGNSFNTNLKIVFSSEFGNNQNPSKRTKAYIGTVTDISGETIQIKANGGEILQIKTSDDTSYVNLLKKAVSVKNTDLAIGDYIVAMGYINGNKVLDTKRILITSELTNSKRKIIWGKINNISKKQIVITNNQGENFEITLPKKWEGPDTSDLKEDQKVIVSTTLEGENDILRTLFTPDNLL